jgi:hypothetical protein
MSKRLAKARTPILAFVMLAIFLFPSAVAVETIDAHLTQAHLPYDEYGTIVIRVDNPGTDAINVTQITLRVYQVRSFTNGSIYTDINVYGGATRITAGGSANFSYMMKSPYGAGTYSCDIVTSLRLQNGTNIAVISAADLYGDAQLVWPQTMGAPLFFFLIFVLVYAVCALAYYILRQRWEPEIDEMERMTAAERKTTPDRWRLMLFVWERDGRIYLNAILWAIVSIAVAVLLTGLAFGWF